MAANDQFKRYYLEKIWEMIPEVYRHEDGLDTNLNRHVLRQFVDVVAEHAAILRRSQDRLWDDQFIALCNEWAVPYLGELVGTRLLSDLNKRGRRIDVAKTIYYRRRKGTPRVLEELITDISGWEGKLVEGFQRLARSRHGLDPAAPLSAGRLTGTMPGGFADIRFPAASELANGPFEEYFHFPDTRKPKGMDGRYGISKVIFYLYRLCSYEIRGVTPFKVANDKFTFDPSGRSIPLFSKRNRAAQQTWDTWSSAQEWELPAPIRCRLLGDAAYFITDEHIAKLQQAPVSLSQVSADELSNIAGHLFETESRLLQQIVLLPSASAEIVGAKLSELLRLCISENCGKNKLLNNPGAVIVVNAFNPQRQLLKEEIVAGGLDDTVSWAINAGNKTLVIDAEQGRFFFNVANPPLLQKVSATYHYGFAGPVGAGPYDRREVEQNTPTFQPASAAVSLDFAARTNTEVIQIDNNRTYKITSDPASVIAWTIQAANKCRPYIILDPDLNFVSGANDATLILDGLWFGAPGGKTFNIILSGNFKSVTIRSCTFDPGNDTNASGKKINPVSLIINAVINSLCIDKSIMGPIAFGVNGKIEDEVCIRDSIVQSVDDAVPAIQIRTGKTNLVRCTVFGSIDAHTLYASDTIITNRSEVIDTQAGCFRFSAAPVNSRLPKPYESFIFESDTNQWFGSMKFGNPHYAQLTDIVPDAIYRGAESRAEMGVFSSLYNAIKYDGLRSKIDEYMPFGLIPTFVNKA